MIFYNTQPKLGVYINLDTILINEFLMQLVYTKLTHGQDHRDVLYATL